MVSLQFRKTPRKSIGAWQICHKSSERHLTFPTTAGYQEAHPTVHQTALHA